MRARARARERERERERERAVMGRLIILYFVCTISKKKKLYRSRGQWPLSGASFSFVLFAKKMIRKEKIIYAKKKLYR